MKITQILSVALISVGVCLATIGCATKGAQPAPSSLDRALFNIQTNVTVINHTNEVFQTNMVPQVVTTTNIQNQVVNQTNYIPVVVPQYVTVPQTNQSYIYTTKDSITGTASAVGAMAGPWGTAAATGLALVLGIWGKLKSNQAVTLDAVAGNATQALATARAVIAALPNGDKISKEFNAWLASHQNDVDIAKELNQVISDYADPTHTDTLAAGILANVTTPLPTKA